MKKERIIALCLIAVMAAALLCGCGSKDEEPVTEELTTVSAEDAAAPVDGAAGEASGEASGDAPEMRKEAADPTGYSADFAGYQEYVLSTVADMEAETGFDLSSFRSQVEEATDENADVFANMQAQNSIVSYDDFLAAN